MTKSKPKKMNTGGLAKSQKSLKSWTKQDWRTKSGKPSTQGSKATGERYLPAKAIKSLIATAGSKAAYSMMQVMTNPTDLGNKEKMAAAKDFLDRAGFVKTDKVEIKAENPVFILPPKNES